MTKGRKAASDSLATELRERLLQWKRTPEPQRISLRALAAELGTKHQLLSFHLRNLPKWQGKEYRRRAEEISDRAKAEGRPMNDWELDQCAAYNRAQFDCMLDEVVAKTIRDLRNELKKGALSQVQMKIARLFASKGLPEAQEILRESSSRQNNLPPSPVQRTKSFKSRGAKPGNSAKTVPHAIA